MREVCSAQWFHCTGPDCGPKPQRVLSGTEAVWPFLPAGLGPVPFSSAQLPSDVSQPEALNEQEGAGTAEGREMGDLGTGTCALI